MAMAIIWQDGSSNPDNVTNLEMIREWWRSLSGQEIHWRQRLIPANGDVSQLDWQTQQFDESFLMVNSQLRGVTLYWFKPNQSQERNITPHKLELDSLHQILYIFPQSQSQIVIRVEQPQLQYQMIELNDPDLAVGKNGTILIRDNQKLIEVKINLGLDKLTLLKYKLNERS